MKLDVKAEAGYIVLLIDGMDYPMTFETARKFQAKLAEAVDKTVFQEVHPYCDVSLDDHGLTNTGEC